MSINRLRHSLIPAIEPWDTLEVKPYCSIRERSKLLFDPQKTTLHIRRPCLSPVQQPPPRQRTGMRSMPLSRLTLEWDQEMVSSRKEQPPSSVNEARRPKIPRVEPKEKSSSRTKAEMFRARDSSAMASQAEDRKLKFFMEAPIFNTLQTKRVFDAKNSMLSRSFRLSRWFGRTQRVISNIHPSEMQENLQLKGDIHIVHSHYYAADSSSLKNTINSPTKSTKGIAVTCSSSWTADSVRYAAKINLVRPWGQSSLQASELSAHPPPLYRSEPMTGGASHLGRSDQWFQESPNRKPSVQTQTDSKLGMSVSLLLKPRSGPLKECQLSQEAKNPSLQIKNPSNHYFPSATSYRTISSEIYNPDEFSEHMKNSKTSRLSQNSMSSLRSVNKLQCKSRPVSINQSQRFLFQDAIEAVSFSDSAPDESNIEESFIIKRSFLKLPHTKFSTLYYTAVLVILPNSQGLCITTKQFHFPEQQQQEMSNRNVIEQSRGCHPHLLQFYGHCEEYNQSFLLYQPFSGPVSQDGGVTPRLAENRRDQLCTAAESVVKYLVNLGLKLDPSNPLTREDFVECYGVYKLHSLVKFTRSFTPAEIDMDGLL